MEHTITIVRIKEIAGILKAIKERWDICRSRCKEWTYKKNHSVAISGEYCDKKIYEEKQAAEAFALSHKDKLYACCTAIEEAEELLEAETMIDLEDTDLINAINLIKAMGSDTPIEQQKKIAKQFSGNYPAEEFLIKLYDKEGLAYRIEKTDFYAMCQHLTQVITFFVSDAGKSFGSCNRMQQALNAMLEKINCEYRIDLGIDLDASIEAAHIAAGLEMVK